MKKESTVIVRKIAIIPTHSESKAWEKKVKEFVAQNFIKKIEKKEELMKKTKDAILKEKYTHQLSALKQQLDNYEATGTITQQMVNDYTYTLVRDSMESEARRKNYILSYMFSEMTKNGVGYLPTVKEKCKWIQENIKPAYRVKGRDSIFDNTDIESPLGGYGISFNQMLTSKLKDAVKKGLLEGKVSLPCYKLDSPFTVAKNHFSFEHEYDSLTELAQHIYEPSCKLYFNLGSNGNPTIARFRINLGHKKNRDELLTTLYRIFSGDYEACGSSIQISKNKIILNLSISIPKKEMELDENVVVGVYLGTTAMATCGLNNNGFNRKFIGNKDDFFRTRMKFQERQQKLQQTLAVTTKGGHGIKKKLRALDRVKDREKNFAETSCHQISRKIVDFAIKNHAKYINLQNLTGCGDELEDIVLRNWSYYKLQSYITYKAEACGITVRKVNPCYISEVCNICGERGVVTKEGTFICSDPNCKTHRGKKMISADHNAAKNIADSTMFKESGSLCQEWKEEAAAAYQFSKLEEDVKR